MFEQSILASAPAGRKTSAVFASFAAQIGAVGVLICVPLFYNDVLPRVNFSMPLVGPVTAPPEPVATSAKATPVAEALHTRSASRIFRPLTRDAGVTGPQSPAILGVEGVPEVGGRDFSALVLPSSAQTAIIERPRPPVEVPKPPETKNQPVNVGGDVQAAKIIKRILPVYPALAKQARVSGTVHLVGVIAKDGTVQKLEILSGNVLLVRAAVDAVRQWRYQPTTLNGQPVEVIAPIDVVFQLQ
jgi:protein TonB